MVTQQIFYGLKCNRCQCEFEDGDQSHFSDEETVIEYALESDWIEKNGKHYCSDCYDIDEDTNQVTILEEFPEHLKTIRNFIEKVVKGRTSVSEDSKDFKIVAKLFHARKLDAASEQFIRYSLGEKFLSIEYREHGPLVIKFLK